jgi:hypothetical protein
MKRRRAASLIELLLAMSACVVVLTMSTALIHRVLHAQSKTRRFFDSERAALRLTEQFRRDVHIATRADDANLGEGIFLRLQFTGDRAVEYHRSGSTVVRIAQNGSGTRAREEFAFSTNIDLTVRKESGDMIALMITSQPGDPSAEDGQPRSSAYCVPVSVHAEARLNRTPGVTGSPAEEKDSP